MHTFWCRNWCKLIYQSVPRGFAVLFSENKCVKMYNNCICHSDEVFGGLFKNPQKQRNRERVEEGAASLSLSVKTEGWCRACGPACSCMTAPSMLSDKDEESRLSQYGSWPFNSPFVCVTLAQESWHTCARTPTWGWEEVQKGRVAKPVSLLMAVCRGSDVGVMREESGLSPSYLLTGRVGSVMTATTLLTFLWPDYEFSSSKHLRNRAQLQHRKLELRAGLCLIWEITFIFGVLHGH